VTHSTVAATLVLCLCALGCKSSDARDDAVVRPPAPKLDAFSAPAVHSLALTIDRSAMAELARTPKEWVRATLQVGANSYPDVAVRFKGHRSLRTWAEKPAFKLAFDKFKNKGRKILGLRGMTLNNMVDDPSMLRENLGAQVFAALGVPAPRANYAEVSVNGERYGLYVLLESIDETLLARHFGAAHGPVYEGEYGCDLYDQDVWGFEHDGGDDPERAALQDLARRISGPADNWLLSSEAPLQRAHVLAYLAASTLLADFDGYRHGHNYRIYLDSESRNWSFIPWGFDRILKKPFGAFDSQGRIARACFGNAACRLEYVRTLRAGIEKFEKLDLVAAIARTEALIGPALVRDPRRPYSQAKRTAASAELAKFIAEQPQRLRKQLGCWDGEHEIDADGDGYGCMDCDDSNASIHPSATEACDGADNDCSGHADDAPSCSCPIQRVGGASYALCSFPTTFWEAELFCHSLGYTLARVDSRDALKALQSATQSRHKGEWWVGLSDQAREGEFVWPDGSRPVRGLWASGEPDNYVCGQNCAAIRPGRSAGLRDLHCGTHAPFVCSVDEPPAPAVALTSPTKDNAFSAE
jgi:hypothetical protein